MGTIIINVTLGNITYSTMIHDLEIRYVIAVSAIMIAFFITRSTGAILTSLFISMTLFITTMGIILHE